MKSEFVSAMLILALFLFIPSGMGSDGGILTNTTGATPFYVNGSNPTNISLSSDTCLNVAFLVNATGELNVVREFYAYVNGTDNTSLYNVTAKINITIIERPKSGTVSNVTGTIPFYVNSSNPTNISLLDGGCQNVTWWVNATGNVSGVHEFYAYVNRTADMSVSNQTAFVNITIIAQGAAPPAANDSCSNCDGTADCYFDCKDECNISSGIDMGGFDLTINQSGAGNYVTTFTADITNYGVVHIEGFDSANKCRVVCLGGCFID